MKRILRIIAVLLAVVLTSMGKGKEENDLSIKAEAADLNKINCGNLVYAANQTSVCFADAFLAKLKSETQMDVMPHYVRVALDSDKLFNFPFCVFSGEGSFQLTQAQRDSFRKYLLGGGFILASPGCSDSGWIKSLHTELQIIFPDYPLQKIPMDNSIFSVVYKIDALHDKQGKAVMIDGIIINGRVSLINSVEGLNDVANAKGCCCCGGNEIKESQAMNVNIITYALLY